MRSLCITSFGAGSKAKTGSTLRGGAEVIARPLLSQQKVTRPVADERASM